MSTPRSCRNLDDLWRCVDELNQQHFPDNDLMPILGNGRIAQPKVMFVFINPTARNISSDPDWQGPRFPFIGTKQVWRVFNRAGLLDEGLMRTVEDNARWSLEFTDEVLGFLRCRSFYLTNIVKWTGRDATLPDSKKIRLFLPILEREIELVQPEYIVAFGLIPFEKLTRQKIRLRDYYAEVMRNGRLEFFDLGVNAVKTKVIPCYFPVGRGDPRRAINILKLVAKLKG